MALSYILTVLVFFTGGILIGAGVLLWIDRRYKRMYENMRACVDMGGLAEQNKHLKEDRKNLLAQIARHQKKEEVYRKQLVNHLALKKQVEALKEESAKHRETIAKQTRNENERFGSLMKELIKQGIKLPQELLNEITPI